MNQNVSFKALGFLSILLLLYYSIFNVFVLAGGKSPGRKEKIKRNAMPKDQIWKIIDSLKQIEKDI